MQKVMLFMSKLTLRQLETLVKEKYSLTKALKKVHPENFYQAGQTCFCPFHENHNTPAAAIYDDEKGQSLYCFTERKLYTVVDVFKELMHYDVYELGYGLWQSMSEFEKQAWLAEHEEYEQSGIFNRQDTDVKVNKELEKAIALFKSKKIGLNDLLKYYIENKGEVK